jgi:hypothetical protein
MTQHINLLSKRRARQNMAWLATRGLSGLVGLFVLWALAAEVGLHNMSASNEEMQQTVSVLRVELEQKRRAAGLEDAQVLAKDSAAMSRRMDENRTLMQLVQKGEVGSLAGHSRFMQTLASLPQTGVWLQSVDITNASRTVNIVGSSLTTAAVMQYAEQLNRAFQSVNFEFSSLEISTEDAATTPTSPQGSIIKFRLY